MALVQPCAHLIIDIGDVLLSWTMPASSSLSSSTVHAMLHSQTWDTYERGHLSQPDAYAALAAQFNVEASEISSFFVAARKTLTANTSMINFLTSLKSTYPHLRIWAMSNMAHEDLVPVKKTLGEAGVKLFSGIFISAAFATRKPALKFYTAVLEAAGIPPEDRPRTLFIDDKPENVLAARSLCLRAELFDKEPRVRKAVLAALGDPVKRGWQWLVENKGKLMSETDTGALFGDVFTQLLIFEATGDRCVAFCFPSLRLFSDLRRSFC